MRGEPEGRPRILDLPARLGNMRGILFADIRAECGRRTFQFRSLATRQIESSGTRTRSSGRSSFPSRDRAIEMTFRVGSKSGDKLQRETYPRFPLSPPDPARGDVSPPSSPGRNLGGRSAGWKVDAFRAIRRRKRSLVLLGAIIKVGE